MPQGNLALAPRIETDCESEARSMLTSGVFSREALLERGAITIALHDGMNLLSAIEANASYVRGEVDRGLVPGDLTDVLFEIEHATERLRDLFSLVTHEGRIP